MLARLCKSSEESKNFFIDHFFFVDALSVRVPVEIFKCLSGSTFVILQ